VTLMDFMFLNATSFDQPIANWNVSSVTGMRYMFAYAMSFDHPIGDWDVLSVTDLSFMFANATSFNQSLGNWNVSNDTEIASIFEDSGCPGEVEQECCFDDCGYEPEVVNDCSDILSGCSKVRHFESRSEEHVCHWHTTCAAVIMIQEMFCLHQSSHLTL
jgi:surface protein